MYSFYIIYTYVACFYGFLLPIAAPILVVISSLTYWVDKFNLYKRCSAPDSLSFEHTRILIKAFEISLLLFVLGYILWQAEVHFDSSPASKIINLLNVIVAVTFVTLSLFTPDKFAKKIFHEEDKAYERLPYSYYQKKRFQKTYFGENPATFCLKKFRI
jgi:uncharacterized membrane protein